MQRLFADTSAWFAFVNRADPDHWAIVALLDTFRGSLVTSNFVFDETVWLCLYRPRHPAAARIGQTLRDSSQVDLVRVASEDETDYSVVERGSSRASASARLARVLGSGTGSRR
jgi:predicted nucleic acid-binding protein